MGLYRLCKALAELTKSPSPVATGTGKARRASGQGVEGGRWGGDQNLAPLPFH
jgi:hypothetical protein